MKKYIKFFEVHTQYEDYIHSQDFILPNVSYCDDVKNVVHYNPYQKDNSKHYLTTTALENGTISFNIKQNMDTDMITSVSYSTDNGSTWTTTANQDGKQNNLQITVNVNDGDKVMWKGIAKQMGFYNESGHYRINGSFFSSTAEFDVEGNIMSLCYGDDYLVHSELGQTCQFGALFYDYDEVLSCKVVNAKDLALPSQTLTMWCYSGMFSKCTSLITAPELPATTLASHCYDCMFDTCTSLTTAPELPATTLSTNCYDCMFIKCSALTTAPELPATTLQYMCYNHMFDACTSLTTAPELPATRLAQKCYTYMFYNCSNLNYIKAMFTTTPSGTYTTSWVKNVAESGTFVKNSAATWNVSGVNGIPSGWTIQTANS